MWFTVSPISVAGDLLASSHERIRRSWISCNGAQIAYSQSMDRIRQSREILQRNGVSHVRPEQFNAFTFFLFHSVGGGDAEVG